MVAANGHTIRTHNPAAIVSKTINVIRAARVDGLFTQAQAWHAGSTCDTMAQGGSPCGEFF